MPKSNAEKKIVDMAKRRDQAGNLRSDAASIPRSLGIAANGIDTGGQFAAVMSALMVDLIDGRITPSVGNAVCNAGGKLLKVVEMQQRWGTQKHEGGPRDLTLTAGAGK